MFFLILLIIVIIDDGNVKRVYVDFSTFIWQAGIERSSKGNKDEKLTEQKIFLTAYDGKNLEISCPRREGI